jgi:hypothetical protein
MTHLILHPKQREIIQNNARFKIIRAGRKGGKTALEVENIAFKATASIERLNIRKTEFATGRKVLYIAPTQEQARKIVWEYLKNRLHGVGIPNEQRLEMKVKNEDGLESTIYVGGYENKENYRGLTDVIHITFDEVDTLKNFFLSWKEIFRPMFLDTAGTADFIGTPKKENPNLKRLEKEFVEDSKIGAAFHFTSADNPYLPREELEAMKKEYAGDMTSYKQEVLAEYLDNQGALFSYSCLIDVFSNTIETGSKYLIVDIADDGSDKTIFSLWEGMTEYNREEFERLNTENIIDKIREYAKNDKIPYSHIAVDAIGVGAGVASNSLLDGIIGYKSSYGPIKTDQDIVRLPNVHYTSDAPLTSEYKNLRSQCIFTLANLVNNHQIASRIDGKFKEAIIEELFAYQDDSKGDGKRMATSKEEIKEIIGRSPDHSDTWIMRMYFKIKESMLPDQSEELDRIIKRQQNNFNINQSNFRQESNK